MKPEVPLTDPSKTYCRNPDPSKSGVNIPTFKYDLIRSAICAVVGEAGPAGFPLKDLSAAVGQRLSAEDKDRIGKLGWHMMAVKLEMEAAGDLQRLPKATPQRLILG